MEHRSYAKINLGLRVVGKRPDGFHDIETFFQQIDIHDTLSVEPTNDGHIQITCSDSQCPTDKSNLVYKAVELIRKKSGQPNLGCRIHIDKHIPMGGGLGGGSSNAATMLTSMNESLDLMLSTQQMVQLGLTLGSDVPFFIIGGFAYGSGRGELLKPLAVQFNYYGVLLCPAVHSSTAYVYNNLNLNLTNRDNFANFSGFIPRIKETRIWREHLENDLSHVVFQQYPQFSAVLEQFYSLGAFYAHMSGSGSSLFGLFETADLAQRAEHFFKSKYKALQFRPFY